MQRWEIQKQDFEATTSTKHGLPLIGFEKPTKFGHIHIFLKTEIILSHLSHKTLFNIVTTNLFFFLNNTLYSEHVYTAKNE